MRSNVYPHGAGEYPLSDASASPASFLMSVARDVNSPAMPAGASWSRSISLATARASTTPVLCRASTSFLKAKPRASVLSVIKTSSFFMGAE